RQRHAALRRADDEEFAHWLAAGAAHDGPIGIALLQDDAEVSRGGRRDHRLDGDAIRTAGAIPEVRRQVLYAFGNADVRLDAEIVGGVVVLPKANQGELAGTELDGVAIQHRSETLIVEKDPALDVGLLRRRQPRQPDRAHT